MTDKLTDVDGRINQTTDERTGGKTDGNNQTADGKTGQITGEKTDSITDGTSDEIIFDVAPGEQYVDDRSRLTIFFQVLGRKFWKLITVNLMYMLFNIPAIIVAVFLGMYLMELFVPKGVLDASPDDIVTIFMAYGIPAVMILMAVPVICVGPAQAGMTYLLRCFSYEVPTFTWSDFKDKMKENLKQGIIVCLINMFAIFFLIVDLYLYRQIQTTPNMVFSIANGLLLMLLMIFVMANLYIYPMMVTYKLSIKNIYKNALLFAFAKFLPNLGVLVLCLLLVLFPVFILQLVPNVLVLTITYLYYTILGFSLPGLVINFVINPIIDKYMQPKPAEDTKG